MVKYIGTVKPPKSSPAVHYPYFAMVKNGSSGMDVYLITLNGYYPVTFGSGSLSLWTFGGPNYDEKDFIPIKGTIQFENTFA